MVLLEARGQSTWEDLFAVQDQLSELLDAVPHEADLIVVMHPGIQIPSGNLLPHISRAAQKAPRNLRMTINVGMSPFLKAITQIATTILQMKTYYTNTLDEARAIIARERSKIIVDRP